MHFLSQKIGSHDYYASFIKRKRWVDYLQSHCFQNEMTDNHKRFLLAWIITATYPPGHFQRAARKHQMYIQMNTYPTTTPYHNNTTTTAATGNTTH